MEPLDGLRRCDVQRMTPEELLIYDAIVAVEKLPADVRLTSAVIMLLDAQRAVADFVDGINAAGPISQTTITLKIDASDAVRAIEQAVQGMGGPA